jgi:ATP-dependent phosphoenolpyruvate carboxykinase
VDTKRYDTIASDLCGRFARNFKQFEPHVGKDVLAAGINAS